MISAVGVTASSHAAAVVRLCASCGQGVCNAQRCASPVQGLCTRPGGLSTARAFVHDEISFVVPSRLSSGITHLVRYGRCVIDTSGWVKHTVGCVIDTFWVCSRHLLGRNTHLWGVIHTFGCVLPTRYSFAIPGLSLHNPVSSIAGRSKRSRSSARVNC